MSDNDTMSAAEVPPKAQTPLEPGAVRTTNTRRSEKIGKLAVALASAQAKFTTVKRANVAQIEGGRANYSYNYAELADFLDIARAPLAEAGIAVMQPACFNDDGVVCVETLLVHGESDQWIATDLYLAPRDSLPQSVGSAITYARRYALTALLGLVSEKEDDDGNRAQGHTGSYGKRGQEPSRFDNPYPDAGSYGPPPGQAPASKPKPPSTPAAVQQQLADKGVKVPEKAAPENRGPDDLAKGLQAIKADFPEAYPRAVKMLVMQFGADDNEPHFIGTDGEGRHRWNEAHAELTKFYRGLRRTGATGAGER